MTDPPRLDDQLCFALYAASHAVARAYDPMLAGLGLTYPQLLVMMALWEEDGLTIGALGDRLYLDSGTLTPLSKRLATAGLVTRRRDPEDERRVRLYLTPSGAALGVQAAAAHQALLCELPWDQATNLAALRDALQQLTRTLRA